MSPPRTLIAAFLCVATAGCRNPAGRGVRDDLDAPIFGGAQPTTYVVAPTSGTMRARDLATAARILRRYKTLSAAERALVRSSVSRRLEGLIAFEVRRVEQRPEFRAARAAIRKIADPRIAAVRRAHLDTEIRSEAMRALARRLGSMIATPVRGSDNRSAVVFSRIDGPRVVVQDSAYELDRPIDLLTEGASIDAGASTAASYLASPPVAIAAPQSSR